MSKLSRQNTDQFYISFTVTYATRKKKKSKIQDVHNWFSLPENILSMFLKLYKYFLFTYTKGSYI